MHRTHALTIALLASLPLLAACENRSENAGNGTGTAGRTGVGTGTTGTGTTSGTGSTTGNTAPGTTGANSGTDPSRAPAPAPVPNRAPSDTTTPATSPAGTPTTPGTTPATAPAGTRTAATEDARILSILQYKDNQEVRIGQMAQGKATSAAAKSLADMMVKDHRDHLAQVQATARSANISLLDDTVVEAELKRMRPDQPNPMTVLQPLTGEAFDRRFGELMAQGHRDLIRMCEEAQAKVTNADVKALLAKTLPTLRHHAEMAEQVAGGKPATP